MSTNQCTEVSMKSTVLWLMLSVVVSITGCATTFEVRPWKAEDSNGIKNGISYYQSVPTLVVWQFTQWVDGTGAYKGAAPNGCTPVLQKSEIQSLPDLAHKMVFVQYPSNFSSSKYSVTFKDFGTLASIGSETTPVADKILAVAESAAKDLFVDHLGAQAPACNAGPVIKCLIPIADFGSLPRCG